MRAHCHVDPSDLTKRSVTHSVSQSVRYVGIELPGQLKMKADLKYVPFCHSYNSVKVVLDF